MADTLYFAYGSNMLRERLLARCPTLTDAGVATLRGRRLSFDKISKDGSGKCTIEGSEGEDVLGVLWQVPGAKDMESLDTHEGVGHGYTRCKLSVISADGERIEAISYDATKREPQRRPYAWYLALVIAGARQHDLPAEYIQRLQNTPWLTDPEPNRPTHRAALRALTAADMMGVLDELVG